MTGPPARWQATVSAQIREHEQPALKFRDNYIDVLEHNRRIEVITEAEARRRLRIGGYEAVGNNTIKYLRRLPWDGGPIDGPKRKCPPSAVDNSTTSGACRFRTEHRFPAASHPWSHAPTAGCAVNRSSADGV